MDFVIVGIVIGAALVGAGALLRDLGPRARPRLTRLVDTDREPSELASAWTRFCHALGMAVTGLGFLLVVATFVAFVGNAGDRVGWAVVAIGTVLAMAGTLISAPLISGHYRRGGFDPRPRSEMQAEQSARFSVRPSVAMVTNRIGPPGHGGPFMLDDSEPAFHEAVDGTVETGIASESSAAAHLRDEQPVQPLPGGTEPLQTAMFGSPLPVTEVQAVRDGNGVDDAATFQADIGLATLARPPAQPTRTSEADTEARAEPKPIELMHDDQPGPPPIQEANSPLVFEPQPHVPVLSSFDPPLIDPDDELPAWGAAPMDRMPAPAPYAPKSEVGTAFESSLFADLRPEPAPTKVLAGPFQSRLLNELTGSLADPEGDDVLIAESPVTESNRGARSE